MYLNQLHRIFAWSGESPELATLRGRYDALLEQRLALLLDRVADEGGLAEVVADHLRALGSEDRRALLSTPEVSYRILWGGDTTPADAVAFLGALAEDLRRPEEGESMTNPVRYARRPEVRAPDGSVAGLWPWAAELPIDAGSPYARTVDVAGTSIRIPVPQEPYTAAELTPALAKLVDAATGVQRAAPAAWSMARSFTTMLLLLPDRDAPTQFSSGSSGQFVGRSVIANAHLAKVQPGHVAEALVHEAIHGVLYMDEQHDPWVLDSGLYAGPMRIASPWTGNPLPLRPYLQACFVWYGLLSFWARALTAGEFDRGVVRERIEVAASGFLRGDLLERVEPVASRLAPELLDAVAALQGSVLGSLSDQVAGAAS